VRLGALFSSHAVQTPSDTGLVTYTCSAGADELQETGICHFQALKVFLSGHDIMRLQAGVMIALLVGERILGMPAHVTGLITYNLAWPPKRVHHIRVLTSILASLVS